MVEPSPEATWQETLAAMSQPDVLMAAGGVFIIKDATKEEPVEDAPIRAYINGVMNIKAHPGVQVSIFCTLVMDMKFTLSI